MSSALDKFSLAVSTCALACSTAAVRENLSLLLGTDRVLAYPWSSSRAADYKVIIKVSRLESVPNDYVMLKAQWTVSGGKGIGESVTRESEFREKLNAPGYDAIVAAMSRAFGNLSRDIAAEIIAAGGRK